MKQRIKNYVFSAVDKTLTLPDFLQVDVGCLLLVTNVTRQTALFNFYDPSVGTADVNPLDPNQFVLTADTSLMLDSDRILVHYEVGPGEPYYDPSVRVELDRIAPLTVENRYGGNPAVETAPGVPLMSLAGSLGEPIDSRQGAIQTYQVNQPDVVTPPLLHDMPQPASANSMGVVVGGTWTVPYSVSPGQNLVLDVSGFRGISISVPTTQGQITWSQSNHPDRNFTAFNMQHATGAISTTNGGGGTTTGYWIGNLACRYLRISNITSVSAGVLHLTAWPNTIQPSAAIVIAAPTDGASVGNAAQFAAAEGMVYDSATTTWNRLRQASAAQNTTGTGVSAAGVFGQYDDVAPTALLEDRYGQARMTRGRALHQTIRDGHSAATEMGVGVTGRNALVVEDANSFLMSSGYPEMETSPGVPGTALVDEFGSPLSSRGGALAIVDVTEERQRVPFSDLGVNTSGILGSSVLLSVVATNVNAAMRYLQLFNGAPVAGARPVLSFPLPAGSATAPGSVALGVDVLGANGTAFVGDVGWGISTAVGTYVAATAADHTVNGLTR